MFLMVKYDYGKMTDYAIIDIAIIATDHSKVTKMFGVTLNINKEVMSRDGCFTLVLYKNYLYLNAAPQSQGEETKRLLEINLNHYFKTDFANGHLRIDPGHDILRLDKKVIYTCIQTHGEFASLVCIPERYKEVFD